MRSIFLASLVAFLSLANVAAVNQPSRIVQDEPPITAEEYWERVRSTRQAIRESEALPGAQIRARLDGLASEWEQVDAVEFPDQSIVQVDSSYLAAELRSDPPDLERLQNLLDALLRAHEEYPQNVFTIQDIEPLRGILARPEFQWEPRQARAVEMPDWLAGIFDAIAEFIEGLAFSLRNVSYYGRVPLTIAAALLFVLALYFISRGLSRNLVREAQLAAQGGDADELLTSKGAIQRAQALSGQGDYRNAIRYLYLSSLLVLDEKGLLRYDRSRTNREYLRSVSGKPGVAEPLRDVIEVFDRVWYGFESVDEASYQSYTKHVDELREKKE